MPIKFLNCNRAIVSASKFRPYDLEVMHDDKLLNDEYFTVSNKGVVQIVQSANRRLKVMRKGKPTPTEFFQLHEWMRQSTMFNVLTSMKFFKHYLICWVVSIPNSKVVFELNFHFLHFGGVISVLHAISLIDQAPLIFDQ